MNIHTGGGTKRLNEDADRHLPPSQTRRVETPSAMQAPEAASEQASDETSEPTSVESADEAAEKTLAHLRSLNRRCPPADLNTLLETLADGTVYSHYGGRNEVREFMQMLYHGDYELFIETFRLFSELHHEAAEMAGEAPFESSLKLAMPPHWNPSLVELHAALSQVKVDRLTVFPSHCAASSEVPVAVCLCVATLLNTGTTELSLSGDLAEPDVIAHAVSTSRLRWIEFADDAAQPSAHRVESSRKILTALGRCATLKHLCIGPPELMALHLIVNSFQRNGGPQLHSVGVGLRTAHAKRSTTDVDAPENSANFLAFMNMVGQIPTLSVCRLRDVQFQNTDSLQKHVLTPLAQNLSLTTLDIEGTIGEATTQARILAPAQLVALKNRCPSLSFLRCDFGYASLTGVQIHDDPSGWTIDHHLQQGGSLTHGDATLAMAQAVAHPGFNLASLSMHGMHITPEAGKILFGAIAHNKSLKHLDLTRCFIELASMEHLIAALEVNDSIEFLSLPLDLWEYYWLVHGLQGIVAMGFEHFLLPKAQTSNVPLYFHRDTPLGDMAIANAAVPRLTRLAGTLFEVTQKRPFENWRNALIRKNHGSLTEPMQTFMSAAFKAAPKYRALGKRSDEPEAFSIPAQLVVEQLSRDESLKWAVKVAEINHAMDTMGLRDEEPAPPPTKELRSLVMGVESHPAWAIESGAHKPDWRDARYRSDIGDDIAGPERPLNTSSSGPRHVLVFTQLGKAQWELQSAASTAIAMGDALALVRALEAGAPVNVVDARACNGLLEMAAKFGNATIVSVLLEGGAKDFGGHALMAARSPDVIALLLPPRTGLTTTNTTATTTTTTTAASTANVQPVDNPLTHTVHPDEEENPLNDPMDGPDNWF